MNHPQRNKVHAIFEKHLQKAINEIAEDGEKLGIDFFWHDNDAFRLANQTTEALLMRQESEEERARNS